MEQRPVLLLELESDGQLANPLRQILTAGQEPGLQITSQQVTDANENDLSEIVLRQKPLLILLVLPRVRLQSLAELLQLLRPGTTPAPVVVVVDAPPEELANLVQADVADFIIPPLRASEVVVRIQRLVNQVSQEHRTETALKEKLGLQQLIGRHPAFLEEVGKIPVIARADISVMISGETGTGKEVVARAIHYLSPRAGKPFVPVNCGAIPVDLLENELFGHEKGAFTGASGSRNGLIREAEQGTLFLDEVNSLSLMAQVKLLRFLQSKEYRQLGSAKELRGDVRIIAASNANLEAEVAAGRLRQDLYYRLNVVPLMLPPLRARAHDIILLARHFLAQYAAKLNSPAVAFSPEAERKLLLYSWPGNVRELEHVIERTVVLCTRKTIEEEHVFLSGEKEQPSQLSFQEMKARVVHQFESDYIQNLLMAYKGNISRAAQAAQKERRTFWELLRKHKIDVQKFRANDPGERGIYASPPG